MKAKVKSAYFDNAGLHVKGDIVEVKEMDPALHEAAQETTSEPKTKNPKTKKA